MSQEETIAKLRQWWQDAPKEERLAINITAAALKVDTPEPRHSVQRRINAHWRRFLKKDYTK
jgi:uncharacterized protein HemY